MQQLTELQEKWLKALESGEYKQAKQQLSMAGGYCCLGLACVISGFSFDPEDTQLPESVRAAMRLRGLGGQAPVFFKCGPGEPVKNLADANDYGATFSEIAAAIRANPENFFLPPEAA